jgi:hypothetical protein
MNLSRRNHHRIHCPRHKEKQVKETQRRGSEATAGRMKALK